MGKLDPGLRAPEASLDLTTIAEQAQTAEALGFDTILMEETKDDPFQVLALAAQSTQRARLGTSVAIAFARSPYVIAQAAWTAQKISAGRFELGLGSQVRGHIKRRYGLDWHPPARWMADYIGAVRALWESWQTQTPVQFSGTHYQINLNVPLFTPAPIGWPNIPIHVAAVNHHMIQSAIRVADGVRLHPVCSPQYIRMALDPAIRPDRAFEVCLKPLMATAADRRTLDERRSIARERLAFYCATPAYRAAFEPLGYAALCDEMAQLSKQGKWDQLASHVDDELLYEVALVATHDELADQVAQRYGGLIDRIELSFPVHNDADADALRSVARAIQHV